MNALHNFQASVIIDYLKNESMGKYLEEVCFGLVLRDLWGYINL